MAIKNADNFFILEFVSSFAAGNPSLVKRWNGYDGTPKRHCLEMEKDGMENQNSINDSAQRSNAKLFEAIRQGDEHAFSRYYEASLDRLVTLVSRITKDGEEARNIAQDTFIKLWQQREQIDPAQSLDGFVSRMAWNAALDFLKRKQSHARYHNEQVHTQNAEDISGEDLLLAEETAMRIAHIIDSMPPRRREVFELSREKNLTYNQIATRTGMAYNTVMNHMKLELQELRCALSLILLYLLLKQ